jgi:A/G-specific adenine glycosylase
MLQQTTVTAVVPYFDRFLNAFPTLETLAAADEQDVLRLWAGLGYYRRARHLHQAAKKLVADHGGTLPDDPDVWAALPGVGRYVLGAVLSQAFDRPLPIVEANTLRVLSRLFGNRDDPRTGPGKKWVWAAAERVLPKTRVGDFNQAMMELGALVCTPTNPSCSACPFKSACVTNRLGLQADIPPKPAAKTLVAVDEVAVAVRDTSGRVLLCRRPPDAKRWADLWEAPHGERSAGETDAEAAQRVTVELTGVTVAPGPEVVTVKHGVTRFAITMICLEAVRIMGDFRPGAYAAGRWVDPADAVGFPLSSPQRTLFAELAKRGRQRRLF